MPWKEQLAQAMASSGLLVYLSEHSTGLRTLGMLVVGVVASLLWLDNEYATKEEAAQIEQRLAKERLDERYVQVNDFKIMQKEWETTNQSILDELIGMRYELLRAEKRKILRETHVINRLVTAGESRPDDEFRLEGLREDLSHVNSKLSLQEKATNRRRQY